MATGATSKIPPSQIMKGNDSEGKKQTVSVDTEGSVSIKDLDQRELIELMLLEMKIIRKHMEFITGEIINEEDL